jgi:Ala-tRNA(Pro) deacylase
MSLTSKLSPQELLKKLEELEIKTTTYEHEAVFTVEESSKIKQDIPGGHTKNLFLKDKKGNFFMIVAEGSAQIKLNSVHSLIGAKGRVSFGKPEALMELLGVKPGSVTAFAPINDIENKVSVIIDKHLLRHELINCHPLTNEMTTTISREDLLRFLKHINHDPQIIQVSEIGEEV